MMREGGIAPSSSTVSVPVVVAETAPLYRIGLAEAVERAEGFLLRAVVDDLQTATSTVSADEFALCIASAGLDDADFHQVSRARATHPHLKFLMVLPQQVETIDAEAAMAAGILGLLEFSITVADLHAAMTAVAAGRTTWAPGVRLRPAVQPPTTGPVLTRRERQVLTLMSQGLGNRAIAGELFISENTVKNHVRRVHEKLGVHTRTEAVIRAAHEGIVNISAT
jgi:DNA-binding NarL/FixJ family response regulator